MVPRPADWSPVVRSLPAFGWAAYVLAASVVDPGGGTLPSTGPLGLVGFDKWLHLATYATLGFLVALGLWAETGRPLAAACLVPIAFGAGVEALQYPIPARSADLLDAAANAVGAVLGVGVWATVRTATGEVVTARRETDRG